MLRHSVLRRHVQTQFVAAATRACRACGRCIEACPRGVLEMVSLPGHRHVHVRHAEGCKGCLRCARACPSGAIQARLGVASSE